VTVIIPPFNTSQTAVPDKVGETDKTTDPVPVFVVTPVPPLRTGRALDNVSEVAEATPKVGVTKVGEVFKTIDPVPEDEPAPVPPEATDNGVVKVIELAEIAPEHEIEDAVAAPRTGVIKVGVLLNTTCPDPVDVLTPVPPEVTGIGVTEVNEATTNGDDIFIIHTLYSVK
jgi:hypothetical protein